MSTMLEKLSGLSEKIKIGVAGIGSIGRGIVIQANITPGIECVAIADRNLERTANWARSIGWDCVIVNSVNQLHDAIRAKILAICPDGNLLSKCEEMDVFIESTSSIDAGGMYAKQAIEHGINVVMMNHESDLMFGPYLMQLAMQNNVQYTVSDGDQPAVLKHLVDEIQFMGFELVMAGNIKGYLDRYTNPTLIKPEADKRGLNHKMCSSYTDGTKLCVEMAVVANGLGLRTDIPGMHGPRMDDVYDVFESFDFKKIWDGRTGIVDYILGATPKGGIFAIGHTDHPHQMNTLSWFPPDMGPGPFYLFYRPFHLGHFESMKTVASVILDEQPILQPVHGFKTNVYAYAKKDLKSGETLDGIGGYACYGMIDNAEGKASNGLPICLADNVELKRSIAKDEMVLLDDIVYDRGDIVFELYMKAIESAKV